MVPFLHFAPFCVYGPCMQTIKGCIALVLLAGTLQRAHDENGVSPNRIKRLKLSEKNGSGAPVDVPVQQPAALSQH